MKEQKKRIQLNAELPGNLKERFKIECIIRKKTMAEAMIEAVELWLKDKKIC